MKEREGRRRREKGTAGKMEAKKKKRIQIHSWIGKKGKERRDRKVKECCLMEFKKGKKAEIKN